MDGFDYVQAIRGTGHHGLVRTEETLDRFLEDPNALIPGVRMGSAPLHDPDERRTLIRWRRNPEN